jgi:hypothetical protein
MDCRKVMDKFKLTVDELLNNIHGIVLSPLLYSTGEKLCTSLNTESITQLRSKKKERNVRHEGLDIRAAHDITLPLLQIAFESTLSRLIYLLQQHKK